MKIVDFFLSIFELIIKLFNKYGIVKVVGYIVLLMCILYTVIGVSRIGIVVKKALIENTEMTIESHDKAVEVRRANTPKINNLMLDMMYRYDADRVSIIEMHNGTNNTAGLPFIYGEMTYEQVRDGISHVDEDYEKVNLSRFQMPLYMEKTHFFYGSVDDVECIDSKFAARLRENGTKYIAGYLLYGATNELGYFGLSWCDTIPEITTEMMSEIAVTSQKITRLLDTSK